MPNIVKDLIIILKGGAMGAANVIPGVSGGTVAFLTGIYERLINSIKSFDINAVKLLLKFKIKEFSKKIDLRFIIMIILGALIGVLSLARLLEFLFKEFQVPTWAFFFGLILASVLGVSKFIEKWNIITFVSMILGAAIAVILLFVPQSEGGDGIAMGSPTNLGSMAWKMKKWWDTVAVTKWLQVDGKFACSFSSSAGWGGGNETACNAMATVLLNFGFLYFGITDYVGKGLTPHYGAVLAGEPRSEKEKEICKRLGRRLSEWVAYYKEGREEMNPLNATYLRDPKDFE